MKLDKKEKELEYTNITNSVELAAIDQLHNLHALLQTFISFAYVTV
jgi:hypothetical protein